MQGESLKMKSMTSTKPERESGIELLRILALFGVVVLHFNSAALPFTEPNSSNRLMLFSTECIFICAVNLFMLISGYFMCTSQRRSIVKILELFVMLYAVKIGLTALSQFSSHTFNPKAYISVPNNYFLILYSTVYLISPYVNITLKKLNHRQLTIMMILLLSLFSIWNIGCDLLGEIRGEEFNGLTTIGMYGAQQGFTVVNFLLCYIVGAYLRITEIDKKITTSKLFLLLLLCIGIIFLWSLFNERVQGIGLRSAWEYCNPFVILEAVLSFCLFKRLHFHSKWVNRIAKSSFMCFLFHQRLLNTIPYEMWVKKSTISLFLHGLCSILAIVIICWILYTVYHLITALLFAKLDEWTKKKNLYLDITIND